MENFFENAFQKVSQKRRPIVKTPFLFFFEISSSKLLSPGRETGSSAPDFE